MNTKDALRLLTTETPPGTKLALEKVLALKKLEIQLEISRLRLKAELLEEVAAEVEKMAKDAMKESEDQEEPLCQTP